MSSVHDCSLNFREHRPAKGQIHRKRFGDCDFLETNNWFDWAAVVKMVLSATLFFSQWLRAQLNSK